MDRWLVIWVALVALTVPLLVQLKLGPALVLSVLPLVPALLPERSRRRALWLLLALWGALVASVAVTALALWAFPAVTSHGSRTMPIGQVFVGGTLGAIAGFLALGRLAPRTTSDVARVSRLCALAVPPLLAVCAFDHLLG